MEWTDIPPIMAAVASVGILIVAVVSLCGNLVSKAIDKGDERLREQLKGYETKNREEHTRLENKIDDVSKTLREVHTLVVRLDERQQAAENRDRQQAAD